MKTLSAAFRLLTFVSLASLAAQAAVISDFTGSLTASALTQTGRLSRNGVPQDWTGDEPFSGVINTTTVYHYQTYSINVGSTSFVQIDVDSLSANTFVSAYDTSYLPDSAGTPNFGFDTNWLGDAGSSGNYFGTDPIFFQVLVPAFDNLVIVVNQTAAGTTGLGDPYHITVEGFIDSEFTDAPQVPEPSAINLAAGGLTALLLAGLFRRFRVARRS